ncbi:hypothetical protein GOODEAATRI_011622 [Goodea atripinnis]|uniref:Uncharacterized protein n=1 Tax=Goodea atripinnis TaxID=208336 RepID=A0ABV0MGZ7_9TELE
MGNQCSAFKRGKETRKGNNKHDKKTDDSDKVKSEETSLVAQSSLEDVRDKNETSKEETSWSQAEQTSSVKIGDSTENCISLANKYTTLEVHIPRYAFLDYFILLQIISKIIYEYVSLYM